MPFNPTYATVENEDCNLHYWYQGSGPLLAFIPGGNGHGRQYNSIMSLLSDRYTVATFDRRQMSSSQVKINKLWNPAQQARDAVAVVKAMGFSKSSFFCSSSGGVVGFQLAVDSPEIIEHIICHEAPTTALLPDGTKYMDMIFQQRELYQTSGVAAAFEEFQKHMIGYENPDVPPTVPPEPENGVNFWENEAVNATIYCPDLRKIKANGTSIGIAVGARSRDAHYARTTIEQQKILGCLRVVFPGHHQGFEVESDLFAPVLIDMLQELKTRKAA
jgi:pimeloyl-ACP methyl ester carboxylesterase